MSKGHKIGLSVYRENSTETDKFDALTSVINATPPAKTARLVDGKRWGANAPEGDQFDVENVSNGEFTVTMRYSSAADADNSLENSLQVGNKEKLKLAIPLSATDTLTSTLDAHITNREITAESGKLIDVVLTFMPDGDATEATA